MTHEQALEFKYQPWFVRITCDLVGDYTDSYVVHAECTNVDGRILTFNKYADLVQWSKVWAKPVMA